MVWPGGEEEVEQRSEPPMSHVLNPSEGDQETGDHRKGGSCCRGRSDAEEADPVPAIQQSV